MEGSVGAELHAAGFTEPVVDSAAGEVVFDCSLIGGGGIGGGFVIGEDGKSNHFGGAVDSQFAGRVGSMFFDGLHADSQFHGDAFVGMAVGHELNNLHFAAGQPADLLAGRIASGEPCAVRGIFGGNGGNRGIEVAGETESGGCGNDLNHVHVS
ncbi:MAG: hypothetical protein RLZZ458_1818 [Planctomycetota bacterium]